MKIKIENLTKTFKGSKVLDNISYSFDSGKIYGLSGRNGSGKTMLMRAICGLIRPTDGFVEFDGKRLWRDISFPPNIGVLIENPSFISRYSGFKNLKILASIQNKISDEQIRTAIQKVGLDPFDKKPYRKYSLGMKQRLGIACAIMEDPDIVLLDEPTNALDENGVKLIKEILMSMRENRIIIISCHDKEDLEFLSDEIIMISNGKLKN
ncbi:MAG: ABC transporter ATP-binding protein [Ruminococcus sp.]|nr:ABC transporter ATP-binding protein [Ruminococcus sp.]